MDEFVHRLGSRIFDKMDAVWREIDDGADGPQGMCELRVRLSVDRGRSRVGLMKPEQGRTLVIDPVRYAVIAVALVAALLAYLNFRRGEALSRPTLITAGLALLGVLTQAAIAAVQMARGHQMSESAVFVGYLGTTVLMLPAAGYFARLERSRWSSLVMVVAALVVAVLEVRLNQLWTR